MSTPIDAAAALALTADLYRQWTETQQQLAATQEQLAILSEQHDRLLATVRASVDMPDDEVPDESRSTAPPSGAHS